MKRGVTPEKDQKDDFQISSHPAFSQEEEAKPRRVRKRKMPIPKPCKRVQPHRECRDEPLFPSQEHLFSDDEISSKECDELDDVEDEDYHPYVHQPKSTDILTLMGAKQSPAKNVIFRGNTPTRENQCARASDALATTLRSPSRYIPSSPGENPSILYSPVGKSAYPKSRDIIVDGDTVSIYLPKTKVGANRLPIPDSIADTIKTLKINQDSLGGLIDVPVTLKKLQEVKAQKARDKAANISVRYPAQRSVMGCGPNDAAKGAGLDLAKAAKIAGMNNEVVMHWCHFIPHSLIGNTGQIVKNLGLATKFCNAEMTLVEPVVEQLLNMPNAPETLYISVEPQYCKGYEKIKLIDRIIYTVKDGKGDDYNHAVTFSFDGLSLNKICESEQEVIRNLLVDIFTKDKNVAKAQPRQLLDLTPKKLAQTSPRSLGCPLIFSPYSKKGARRRLPRPELKPIPPPLFVKEDATDKAKSLASLSLKK